MNEKGIFFLVRVFATLIDPRYFLFYLSGLFYTHTPSSPFFLPF